MSHRISDKRAIEIAHAAIAGHVDLTEPDSVVVKRADGVITVTFPHTNPPGVRGPDFEAQVTIDAATGDVITLLGGS